MTRASSDTRRIEHLIESLIIYDSETVNFGEVISNHSVDVVIHTATNYGKEGSTDQDILNSNLYFPQSLVEAASKNGVSLFMNTDTFFSDSECTDPRHSKYASSKKQFRNWLESRSGDIAIVNMKLHHMFGPADNKDKFVPMLLAQMINGSAEIELTEGEQFRDFIYVDDVVSAYLSVLSCPKPNHRYRELSVCTGEKTSVKDFAEELLAKFREVYPVSCRLAFGSRPYAKNEIMDVDNDNSELLGLGWCPAYSTVSGIEALLEREVL